MCCVSSGFPVTGKYLEIIYDLSSGLRVTYPAVGWHIYLKDSHFAGVKYLEDMSKLLWVFINLQNITSAEKIVNAALLLYLAVLDNHCYISLLPEPKDQYLPRQTIWLSQMLRVVEELWCWSSMTYPTPSTFHQPAISQSTRNGLMKNWMIDTSV